MATNITHSEKIVHFNQLSSFAQEVCLSLVLAPSPLRRSDFMNLLHELSITEKPGKKATYQSLGLAIDTLCSQHYISYDLRCAPELEHFLLLKACRSSLKDRFIQFYGLDGHAPSQFFKEGTTFEYYSLRFQFYLHSEQTEVESKWAQFMEHPLYLATLQRYIAPIIHDYPWLDKLYFPLRVEIYHFKLHAFRQNGPSIPKIANVLNTIKEFALSTKSERAASILLQHALFEIDLRLAPTEILNLAKNPILDASIYFLQGQFNSAKELFEANIKHIKKEMGTRKFALNGIAGIYYILTLMKLKSFDTAFDVASLVLDKYSDFFRPVYESLQMAIHFLKTAVHHHPGVLDPRLKKASLFCQAFMLLCQYWIDNKPIAKHVIELESVFTQIQTTHPGIARLFAEILDYKSFLKETKQLYAISFKEIVEMQEDWEHSLNALERLFDANETESKKTVKEGDRRLTWVVNLDRNPTISHALEQKQNAKGVWSKGRVVAMERLKNGGPDLDYVTDHDKKVMKTITTRSYTTYGYYTKEEHSFHHGKALHALIGHPHILDEIEERELEFVKGNIELHVQEKGDQFALSLSHPCKELATFVESETPTRYKIFQVTEELAHIQQAIGNEILFPKSSKKRLSTLIKTISKKLPVCSELDEHTVQKEGDPTPYLQMTPAGTGIKMNLYVYPFGEDGATFKPGIGFATPTLQVKGKPQRISRDLEGEKQLADQLIEQIEPLQDTNEDTGEWFFEKPQEVLEVLSLLQNYPGPLKMVWPSGKKIQVSPPATSKSLSLNIKSDRDWFALDGHLQVSESEVIELKKLLELLDEHEGRFIPINNTQIIALTHHFEKQLREFKAIAEQSQGKIHLHPLSSDAISDLLTESNLKADAKWTKLKEKLKNAQSHTPQIPPTLQAELRSYQIEGFNWLSTLAQWGVGACLADDMGLGKTLQAIALILEHSSKGPTLVITPTSVCHNWIGECTKFAPTLRPLLHASVRNTEPLGPMDVLITSYGLLNQEIELLSKIKWQTIILDEAQSIKNFQTKRSQAAMQLNGEIKVILTGTPLENRLSEIWNLFRFINPGLLGSNESFQKRFVDPIEQRKDGNARQALKKLIQPFILRRLKTQVLTELPPRIEKTIRVPLSAELKAFYEALRQTAVEKLTDMSSKENKRIHILAEITKMRRACCDPSLAVPDIQLPSAKLEMLLELLDELKANKHRALVFSQFVGFLEIVSNQLKQKGVSFQYLDGSTPQQERQKRVQAFQNGEGDLFLISLKAGGTGLNLTAADYVIHLDPWWNPAVEDQASDRAHRMGQTRPVTIYRLITEGTIEEKMIKLHQDKRTLATDLLEGTDMSGKLNDDELLALL